MKNDSNKDFENKRKEERINKEIKVDYEFFYLDEIIKYGFGSSTASMDVSSNGIRLIEAPDADIDLKNPIEMKMTFPGTDEKFTAIGQVKWRREKNGIMQFGVEIVSMSEWEKFKKKF